MVDDERRLYRLPIAGKSGGIWAGIFGTLAGGDGVDFGVFGREQAGFRVDAAHFDAGPEAAEGEPGLAFFVEDEIGIDGVEVIFEAGLQDEAVIDPVKIGALGV